MEMKHGNPYGRLALMALASFVAMYALMYAMADRLDNVYPNFNQAYMAALMTAPMVLIELALMGAMYPDRRKNLAAIGVSTLVLVGAFFLVRQQTAIGDAQFLRSMIPHHAGAVLMCEKAQLRDPEIQQLCRNIMVGQQAEIAQMKTILQRVEHH